ncbi:MAG: GAF domain-containing SpoIIE family protein phosphatase [Candidatus Ozemobacteraceae bacterium]
MKPLVLTSQNDGPEERSHSATSSNDILGIIERLSKLTCVRCGPEELIRKIINEVPGIVKVGRLSLMLLHREGLSVPASIGLPQQYMLIPDIEQAPVVRWVVENGIPLVVENANEDPRCTELGFEPNRYSSGAFISLPLTDKGKVIGVLNLTDRLDDGHFSNDEVRTLQVFSGFLSFALSNALLKKRLDLSRRRLRNRIVEIKILYKLVKSVSKALELEGLARLFVKLVPSILGVSRASIVLRDPASNRLFILESVGVGREFKQSSYLRSSPVIEWVIKNQKPLLVDDIANDLRFSDGHRDAHRDGYQRGSFISVPLFSNDQVIGVLSVSEKRRGKAFLHRDLKLVTLFGNQLGVTLANIYMVEEMRKRDRFKEEMNIARMIQQQFLPLVMPEFPGVDIAASLTSAEEIGGDFYHFIKRDDGRFSVFIGDVSGKGIPAALTMVLATSHMGEMARSSGNPTEFMKCAHRLLCHFTQGKQFITVAMLTLAPNGRSMEYCLAGHLPILHYRKKTGDIVDLAEGGMPLGLYLEYDDYPFEQIKLDPGDRLFLYTDGVIDARNRANGSFGVKAVKELILAHASESASILVDTIRNAISLHCTGMNPFDDTTLIGLGID